MPRRYKPAEVIRALVSVGWEIRRQRGSHVFLSKTGTRYNVSVPMSKQEVPEGTFRSILKKAGLKLEKFDEFVRR